MLFRTLCRHSVRRAVRSLACNYSNTGAKPHICIVGSGPAGFYTAQQLLKGNPDVHVDIYERLPVPFGLVRFGVAPDHPEVKNVINTFTQIASNDRCSFIGNVAVGRDITVTELRRFYTAVILSCGADDDKRLEIPGENLPNILSARNFVGWYNGLPEDKDLNVDLSTDTAIVLGQGNVALDVARILLTPVDILAKTDITEYSLELLKKSCITKVILVGRRGPLHVAFTIKELREMIKLPACRPILCPDDFHGLDAVVETLPRPRKRITELMLKTALNPDADESNLWSTAKKEWALRFRLSPLEVLCEGSKVTGVRFGINKLEGPDLTSQKPVLTDKTEDIPCGLVLRSIGYRSKKIDPAIPFDEKNGVIKNYKGKVCGEKGLYCSGWVGRGPVGVIITTMTDAFDAGKTVLKDLDSGILQICSDKEGALKLLRSRGVDIVSFKDWEKIDKIETRNGELKGKSREKIVHVDKLMDLIKS